MDPFTAFGLADNILQFIDFTARLLDQAEEIRIAGSAASIIELANATRDLDILAQKLTMTTGAETHSVLAKHDQAIHDMSLSCATLAAQLSVALRKVEGLPGQNVWRTFRQTLLTVWTQKQVTSLSQRLDAHQHQLRFRMIVIMKENIDLLTAAEENRVSDAGSTDYVILNSIVGNSDKITSNLYETAVELRNRIDQYEKCARERHEETIGAISQRFSAMNQPSETTNEISNLEEASLYIPAIVEFIKKSLQFERMRYREEDIVVAHEDTFEWALSSGW